MSVEQDIRTVIGDLVVQLQVANSRIKELEEQLAQKKD